LIHKITEFDIIYLSYDEPNAEECYANLCNQVPWAKRVHGVKGFDSAHRACADLSETDFFITVDGDNVVYPEFFDLEIKIEENEFNHAWTWAGRNNINGLVYGNGGLKLWSKEFVYNMNTHEHAQDSAAAVDFCWHNNYHEVEGCYSTSVINSTAYQAWRSGFREGVKMSLDRGQKVSPEEFLKKIWSGNINRLSIWSSIGSDIENGIWAIFGARLGCHHATLTNNNHTVISDYSAMDIIWRSICTVDPYQESINLGHKLSSKLGLDITLLNPSDSKFFKSVYMNPPRPYMSWNRIKHFMATHHV
jgi:hypothetical protein